MFVIETLYGPISGFHVLPTYFRLGRKCLNVVNTLAYHSKIGQPYIKLGTSLFKLGRPFYSIDANVKLHRLFMVLRNRERGLRNVEIGVR
jgi:hypothetical protein